jgi:hypothetical protein
MQGSHLMNCIGVSKKDAGLKKFCIFLHMCQLVQSYDIRVHYDFLEVFAINFQTIPNIGNVIEGGNELIFVMWVAVTLPTNEV